MLNYKMENSALNMTDHWKKTFFSIILVFILSACLFFESWYSIVNIWYRSTTFTHGFLILPISLWLIWTQKDYFFTLEPEIDWKITGLVLLSGFLWLVADLSNVLVIKQFATVCLLISSLWLVLGTQVTLKMFFPLFFLFFMVPVGEELVPFLMEFTATFTVGLIRFTGMSVYREGLHFSITSGNWSVVEACSGISYLIASVTLGLVYAYLTYRSFWKRSVFVLVSIIVPVIANGLRAYLIVMIGHFSDMTLAVGFDHLIYGGVFFGLVMMVLFYIGSFWRDPVLKTVECEDSKSSKNSKHGLDMKTILIQIWPLFFVLGLSYAIWPISSNWLSELQQGNQIPQNSLIIEKSGWEKTNQPDWKWKANFRGVEYDSLDYFEHNGEIVALYQASFGKESQGGGELVNSQNLILSTEDKHWKIVKTGTTKVEAGAESPFEVDEVVLRGKESDLLAMRWYRIGQSNTSNDYIAKFLQLIKRLQADDSPEYISVVLIETPKDQYDLARKKLKAFIKMWLGTRV